MTEKLKGPISRREFLKWCGVVGIGTVLAGCAGGGVGEITAGQTQKPTDVVPSTQTLGGTESIRPTDIPILTVKNEGGLYSPEQMQLISENEVLREKIRVLTEDWIGWWATADEPAISIDALRTGRVNVAVKFDQREPENGGKALVVLESQDYPGQNIMQPWDFAKADFMTSVPDFDAQGNRIDKTSGHANVTGMGLFLMSESGNKLSDGSNADWIWQNLGGKPARVDAKTGKLLERINKVGQWERTESDLYQLNGTELSIYNSNTNNYELALDGQGQPLEVTAVKSVEDKTLLIASKNQMLEWNAEQGLGKSEVQGVWPKEIEIKMIEEAEQLDRSGKSVGKIYNGKDQLGRTMLVKPEGEGKWLVAPFGSALSNGVWRVWDVKNNGAWQEKSIIDAQGEMSRSARLDPIAKIVTEELANPREEGTMHSYSNYTDFGMEVVPGREHEVYLKILDAYAKSPVNRKYWGEVGFNGSTGEELQQWLKGSTGGPENLSYWLPGKSSQGTEFSSIVANGGRGAYVRSWDPMVKNGGTYLEDIPYAFISASDYRNSVWAHSLTSYVERQNTGDTRSYIWVAGNVSDAAGMWGMFMLGDRAMFMEIQKLPPGAFPLLSLGGKEGERQDIDTKVATAWMVEYASHLAKYPNKDASEYFCISKTLACSPSYVEVETMTDAWFQFK